jgi:hypothetical protein
MVPYVGMAKLEPISVRVGTPEASLCPICHRVWVPRWKPMPMKFTIVASVSVVASAAVEP